MYAAIEYALIYLAVARFITAEFDQKLTAFLFVLALMFLGMAR